MCGRGYKAPACFLSPLLNSIVMLKQLFKEMQQRVQYLEEEVQTEDVQARISELVLVMGRTYQLMQEEKGPLPISYLLISIPFEWTSNSSEFFHPET